MSYILIWIPAHNVKILDISVISESKSSFAIGSFRWFYQGSELLYSLGRQVVEKVFQHVF